MCMQTSLLIININKNTYLSIDKVTRILYSDKLDKLQVCNSHLRNCSCVEPGSFFFVFINTLPTYTYRRTPL